MATEESQELEPVIEMTVEEARERWPDESPGEQERKRKLSNAARRRHRQTIIDPETGEKRSAFGGPQPGSGRKPSRRLGQAIAEKAQEDEFREKVVQKVEELLDSEDDRVVLRTIKEVTTIEAKEEELQLRDRELQEKPRAELLRMVASGLAEQILSGDTELVEALLGMHKPNDIEGTAEEIDGDGTEPEPA